MSHRTSTDQRGVTTWVTTAEWTRAQTLRAAVLTAAAYWLGARLGLALTFGPTPVAVLWPPNALLLAALLLAPISTWWVLVLSVLPVHILAELHGGVPLSMVLSWYVSNCFEALLGAALVRLLLPGRVRLDTVEAFTVFVVCATFLATFVSTFLDAGLVSWNGWGASPFWTVWRIRFLSNLLSTQTIVPIVLAIDASVVTKMRHAPVRRRVEAITLAIGVVSACLLAFWLPPGWLPVAHALLFAPLPLLLWAAVRFGTFGISLAFGAVTFLAISGTTRGSGPFTTIDPAQAALSLQLFLFLTGIPLSLLATTSEQRRRLQLKAAESERLLSMTMKAAGVGIWKFDPDSRQFNADGVVVGMMGSPAAQPDSYAGLVEAAPRRRSRPSGEVASAERGSGEYTTGEYTTGEYTTGDFEPARDAAQLADAETLLPERELQVRHPDGSTRWILARGMRICLPDGTPSQITGIAMDITERKRIEQAMRDYHERLSLAATAADIGLWSLELETGDVWLSDQCYSMIGAAQDENPRSLLERLSFQPSLSDAVAHLERTFRQNGSLVEELRVGRPDGSERWIATSARLERDSSGQPIRIIGVSRDVTDQRQAERQADERGHALSHLSRVATVGELTATIVHEVGQPLGAITLNVQSLLRLADAAEPDLDELRAIALDLLRDALRAGHVVTQLRDLLRRGEVAREQLDLRTVIQDALDLARGELMKQSIHVVVHVPDTMPAVWANRAQIQQVLLNVILNARDAINAGAPSRRQLVITASKGANDVVSVRVADSGGGIAIEHLGHVFEPFYTSKSGGLGLGLSVSRSIMLEHGGDLRAENDSGGAVLQLSLPASTSTAPARGAGPVRGPADIAPPQQAPANP